MHLSGSRERIYLALSRASTTFPNLTGEESIIYFAFLIDPWFMRSVTLVEKAGLAFSLGFITLSRLQE